METMETREELQSQELKKVLDAGFEKVLDQIHYFKKVCPDPAPEFMDDWSDLSVEEIRKRILLIGGNYNQTFFRAKYKGFVVGVDTEIPYVEIGFLKSGKRWKKFHIGDFDLVSVSDEVLAKTNARLEKLLQEGIKSDEVSN